MNPQFLRPLSTFGDTPWCISCNGEVFSLFLDAQASCIKHRGVGSILISSSLSVTQFEFCNSQSSYPVLIYLAILLAVSDMHTTKKECNFKPIRQSDLEIEQ